MERAGHRMLGRPGVSDVPGRRPLMGRTPTGSVAPMSRHTIIRRGEAHPGHREVAGGLARAAVFGMSDGLTSNVLLVIGFAGSGVDSSVVRLAGIAGAVAGAVSMGAGEWISISAQNELITRELEVERRELGVNTEAEQRELAEMYQGHGMEVATARQAADEVMRDHERALNVHAREEFGIDPTDLPSAWLAAGLSFICFVLGAVLPVIPWFTGSGTAATVLSVVIGVIAAAGLGWSIGQFAERNRSKAAARQVLIMLAACVITYSIGKALNVSVS
jgi:vacuolar iron transporter family protein